MIYYESDKIRLCEYKLTYSYKGENKYKYVAKKDKQWWLNFADYWAESFEVISFEEISYPSIVYDRLDKVNKLKIKDLLLVEEYIKSGKLDGVSLGNPLYVLKIEDELKKAKQKDLMSSFAVVQLDSKILELEERLNEFSK